MYFLVTGNEYFSGNGILYQEKSGIPGLPLKTKKRLVGGKKQMNCL
jgi:hypothetical protein